MSDSTFDPNHPAFLSYQDEEPRPYGGLSQEPLVNKPEAKVAHLHNHKAPVQSDQVYSEEIEQTLLGCVILDSALMSQLMFLEASDFYAPAHQELWQSILEVLERFPEKKCDASLLKDHLIDSKTGDQQKTMITLIGNALSWVVDATCFMVYARKIKEYALRRNLILLGQKIQQKALRPGVLSGVELIQHANADLSDLLGQHQTDQGAQSAKEVNRAMVREVAKSFDQSARDEQAMIGLATGFQSFDQMTSGLQRGDLVILAARPSMGKTAFALNLAQGIIRHLQQKDSDAIIDPMLFFSLEMPSVALMYRLVSSSGRIPLQALRRGQLNDSQFVSFGQTSEWIQKWPLYFDDTTGRSVADVKHQAHQVMKRCKAQRMSAIFIDYLQLLQGPRSAAHAFGGNRTQEIAAISRGLKVLAMEMDCPIIALSQLSRNLESRTDKRPIMSDLRESGSIEQDADLILTIYRDEVYNKQDDKDNTRKRRNNQGLAEIAILKQKQGSIGTLNFSFDGSVSTFSENIIPLEDD